MDVSPSVVDTAALPIVTEQPTGQDRGSVAVKTQGTLTAQSVSAWFGTNKVLDRVSLTMPAGQVTALIGPSGSRRLEADGHEGSSR